MWEKNPQKKKGKEVKKVGKKWETLAGGRGAIERCPEPPQKKNNQLHTLSEKEKANRREKEKGKNWVTCLRDQGGGKGRDDLTKHQRKFQWRKKSRLKRGPLS